MGSGRVPRWVGLQLLPLLLSLLSPPIAAPWLSLSWSLPLLSSLWLREEVSPAAHASSALSTLSPR
jgi:hypothetical protein